MNPRGKVKQLIEAMEAQPDKLLWSPTECAQAMGSKNNAMSASLGAALRHEWLFKHTGEGRAIFYSLRPPAEEEEAPEAFAAALWDDGEVVLRGVRHNEDGSVTLAADQVRRLCRLLHGQGPEA